MRITLRNIKLCLICNRYIAYFDEYECPYCIHSYHKSCLRDMFFINNNSICFVCHKNILSESSLLYDISKCLICEFLPGVLSFGAIIGLIVFFSIDKN